MLEDLRRQIYQCQRCGGCRQSTWKEYGIERVCPSYEYLAQWEPYSARGRVGIARGILEDRIRVSDKLLEAVYTCTTCGNCRENCFSYLPYKFGVAESPPLDTVKVVETLRSELVKRGRGLERHRKIVEYAKEHHNPYNEPHSSRFDWFSRNTSNSTDIVYYVGCTSPYRLPDLCKTTVDLLDSAEIDYTLLEDEWCCGSVFYRTGYWDLGDELAKHNLSLLKRLKPKMVLFSCAGCYRTFKVDYAERFGGLGFEVLHVTELLDQMIRQGKLKFKNTVSRRVTYHDPCHLGRHSGVYEAPRNVLRAIPKIDLVDMFPTREHTMCCGAGGGVKSAFAEFAVDVATARLHAAEKVGAEALVSACPFCERNFSDAAQKNLPDMQILDVVKLASKAV